jgi:hypothetical protein
MDMAQPRIQYSDCAFANPKDGFFREGHLTCVQNGRPELLKVYFCLSVFALLMEQSYHSKRRLNTGIIPFAMVCRGNPLDDYI